MFLRRKAEVKESQTESDFLAKLLAKITRQSLRKQHLDVDVDSVLFHRRYACLVLAHELSVGVRLEVIAAKMWQIILALQVVFSKIHFI